MQNPIHHAVPYRKQRSSSAVIMLFIADGYNECPLQPSPHKTEAYRFPSSALKATPLKMFTLYQIGVMETPSQTKTNKQMITWVERRQTFETYPQVFKSPKRKRDKIRWF